MCYVNDFMLDELKHFDASNECVALIHWFGDIMVFNIDEKKEICSIKNEDSNNYHFLKDIIQVCRQI